jgi:DNA repair protein RecO (recombination protein O)
VSPRSGRAVSREAGAPYGDKLLALPGFLLDETAPLRETDIAAGFALTGFFLERDVLEPHGMKLPSARERLLDLLSRGQAAALSA